MFFRNYTTFYLVYLIVVTQEILFWHLILFIKIRISALNKHLQGLGSENKPRKEFCVPDYGDNVKFGRVVVCEALEKIEVCEGSSRMKRSFENMSLGKLRR